MSKRRGGGRFSMPGRQLGGGGGLGDILQQAQKMQAEMAKAHEELADETIEVSAGGGMVTIVITGQQEVRSITLKPEVVDPDDIDMLQDLLVAAFNQAVEQSKDLASSRLEGLTGGLNIPGL
ncbi:MAG: YbaB/EbfC family nucleoid-associated protein [Anaerolineae bacterium]|nr:YbaB/EbfC family nucleoid-associated protein [Anaerolineae bacterium]